MAYHRRRKRIISAISLKASSYTDPSRYIHVGDDQGLHEAETLPTVGELRAAATLVQEQQNSNAVPDKAMEDAQALVNRLRMYGKHLPGSPLHMDLERRRLLALMGSGALETPFNLFVTYGANDYNWPELYEMIGAPRLRLERQREEERLRQQQAGEMVTEEEVVPGQDEASACKADRLQMLAANPYLATLHYFDREEALTKYILNGERKPLGIIVDDWLRHDGYQRGSFHTHRMLATLLPQYVTDALAGTGDTEADTAAACNFFAGDDKGELNISALGTKLEEGFDEFGAPAESPANPVQLDGNQRPLVPDERNPTRRRAPLVEIGTPRAKADIAGVRRACQMHRCTLTCLPKNFKARGGVRLGGVRLGSKRICRFHYPRRLHFGKARRAVRKAAGSNSRTQTYIELPRDHSWINPSSKYMSRSWRGNNDVQVSWEAISTRFLLSSCINQCCPLQLLVEAKGSVAYGEWMCVSFHEFFDFLSHSFLNACFQPQAAPITRPPPPSLR